MMFEKIADGVTKHYKKVIVVWLIALLLAVPAMLQVGNVMDYQNDLGSTEGYESMRAQRIIEENYQGSVANGTMLIVLQADDVSDPAVRAYVLELQQRLGSSSDLRYLTGISSVYSYAELVTAQTVMQLGPGLHLAEEQVNMTAFMVWGIPAMHVQIWAQSGGSDAAAYAATVQQLSELLSDQDPNVAALALGYYNAFAQVWNGTAMADPVARANASVGVALPAFVQQAQLPPEQAQVMLAVQSGFDMTTFQDKARVHGFALNMVGSAANITNATFLQGVYELGPIYQQQAVDDYARSLVASTPLTELPVPLPEELLNNFVSPNGRTMLLMLSFSVSSAYVEDDGFNPMMNNVVVARTTLAQLTAETGAPVTTYVTGDAAISEDMRASSENDMKMIEPVTVFIIVVLMGLMFRSVLTYFLPLGAVGVAIGIGQALVFVVGTLVAPVNVMINTMLFAILMGVGTDYAIFIISRYREERIRGADRKQAVHASVTWAGESIVTSGATVIIAFFAMSISSFPMVQMMGLSLGLGILVALLVALTLVPALLLLLGNRIFWPTTGKRFERYAAKVMQKRTDAKHGYFHRAGKFAVKHAKVVIIAAILVSVPSTYLFVTQETSFDFIGAMGNTEGIEGMNAMGDDFGLGRIMPTQVVITGDTLVYDESTGFNTAYLDAIENITATIAAEGMVQQVTGVTRPYGEAIDYRNLDALPEELRTQLIDGMLQSVGSDGRSVLLTVVLKEQPMSVDAVNFMPALRDELAEAKAAQPALADATILVGGSTASNYDMSLDTTSQFTFIEIVVVIGIFLVLMIVLGSLLLPAFAVVSIAMSITWAFALTYLVFGVWLSVPILWLVPLVLFVVLMGIGMDYNVFILTRIREEVHKGKEIKQAVVDAVDWTGGIITALALIMAGAFGSIMLSSNAMLQQFGFALLVAVLLDAMVVRTYIVPAAVSLMGKWAWWAPGPLQRVGREEKRQRKAEEQ